MLFVVLLVTPRNRLLVPQAPRRFTVRRPGPLAPSRVAVAVAVGGVALAAPAFAGNNLAVYTNAATFMLVFVSLGLLVWVSGQISLSHAAFVALGASSFGHLTTGAHLPWLLALVLAGLASVPLGVILAVPAARLSGVYLALATFGFAVLMQRVVYKTGVMFGASGFRSAPRPRLWFIDGRGDAAFYYLVLAVVAAGCAMAVIVTRTRLGRLLRALGESPLTLTTSGLSVNVTRVLVFGLSAFLAGVAGALRISALGHAGAQGYDFFQSLLWLAALATCGTALIASPMAAAVLLAVLPTYSPKLFVDHQALVFGVAVIVAAVTVDGGWRKALAALRAGARPGPVRERLALAAAHPVSPRQAEA